MQNPVSIVKILKFKRETTTAKLSVWSDGTATLSSIFSRVRGKGLARALMQDVCEYADVRTLDLHLDVQRFFYSDSESPNNDQLIKFYSEFGFEVVPDGGQPVTMIRQWR